MVRVNRWMSLCALMGASTGCKSVAITSVAATNDGATDAIAPASDGVSEAGAPTDDGPVDAMGDGCGDTEANAMHCGRCENACPPGFPPNSTPTCSAGTCGFVCNDGFAEAGRSCIAIAAPQLIAPLSTSTVTSRRPNLAVTLAKDSDGARIEVFRDRAATMMVTAFDTLGSRGVPPTELPTGMLFWRARGRIGSRVGTTTSPTWQLIVGPRSASINAAWGTISDVNGDGYADIIVDTDGGGKGQISVHSGSDVGARSLPDTKLNAPNPGSQESFGQAVASVGDVNGDGFVDVVVGAPKERDERGGAYLYAGNAKGLAPTPAVVILGPEAIGGRFGASIAAAGDVNGDGYADVAVGAPGIGKTFVYLGQADLLATGSPVTLPRQAALSVDDGASAKFGSSIAGACDVNGDGFADLIIGAPGSSSDTGSVYVFTGRKAGLDSLPSATLYGLYERSRFGHAIACAGDIDGDGYNDFAVGAPGDLSSIGSCINPSPGLADVGSVVVFRGHSPGSNSPELTILGPSRVEGDFRACMFGASVSNAGDINADGYSDLIVGAPSTWRLPHAYFGMSQLFLGSEKGLQATAAQIITPTQPRALVQLGTAVRGLGDINGDGFGDLAVRTSFQDNYLLVFLGSRAMPPFDAMNTMLIHTDGSIGSSIASLFRPVARPARRVRPPA